MTPTLAQAQMMRQQLAGDPHRPQFHFLPPANWMNDPNGLVHWAGRYHLFYQYNPAAPSWGNIHWGHAVSEDLVHWRDLPIALTPSANGPDKDGCWSGIIVDDGGTPKLLYTGVFPETQCLAMGSQDLVAWEKYSENPVLGGPPAHLDVLGFRDPCVWRENGTWFMTLGTGLRNVGGAVLLYRSADLTAWDFVSVLTSGDKRVTGEMWECPAFFPIADRHVLLFSVFPRAGTYYSLGTFDGQRFTPEDVRPLDLGLDFFAPQTLLDAHGRRIMIGWIGEDRSDEMQQTAGWSGIQSVPRQLTLLEDGLLGITPVRELQTLRGKHERRATMMVTRDNVISLSNIRGNCLELIAQFAPGTAESFGLNLFTSSDESESTSIALYPHTRELMIDRSRSSLSEKHQNENLVRKLPNYEKETYELHIFLDRSVIEIFVDGRACLTSRVYPSRSDSIGVNLFARGGDATLISCDAWEMNSIWR